MLNVRNIMTDVHHPNPHGPPAFVFDIDGVLVRGKHVLPQAVEAMKKVTSISTPLGMMHYAYSFQTWT